jgi:hypothetical protein
MRVVFVLCFWNLLNCIRLSIDFVMQKIFSYLGSTILEKKNREYTKYQSSIYQDLNLGV